MSADAFPEASRTLEAAQLLSQRGFFDDAVSRAYYAMFYAAREALRLAGSEPKTHSGVASEFSRLYVQTGRLPAETARELRRLAAKRADADYEGLRLGPSEARSAVDAPRRFIASVQTTLGAPAPRSRFAHLTDEQKQDLVAQLTREMDAAAENLEFEKAAELRDSIAQIEAELAA